MKKRICTIFAGLMMVALLSSNALAWEQRVDQQSALDCEATDIADMDETEKHQCMSEALSVGQSNLAESARSWARDVGIWDEKTETLVQRPPVSQTRSANVTITTNTTWHSGFLSTCPTQPIGDLTIQNGVTLTILGCNIQVEGSIYIYGKMVTDRYQWTPGQYNWTYITVANNILLYGNPDATQAELDYRGTYFYFQNSASIVWVYQDAKITGHVTGIAGYSVFTKDTQARWAGILMWGETHYNTINMSYTRIEYADFALNCSYWDFNNEEYKEIHNSVTLNHVEINHPGYAISFNKNTDYDASISNVSFSDVRNHGQAAPSGVSATSYLIWADKSEMDFDITYVSSSGTTIEANSLGMKIYDNIGDVNISNCTSIGYFSLNAVWVWTNGRITIQNNTFANDSSNNTYLPMIQFQLHENYYPTITANHFVSDNTFTGLGRRKALDVCKGYYNQSNYEGLHILNNDIQYGATLSTSDGISVRGSSSNYHIKNVKIVGNRLLAPNPSSLKMAIYVEYADLETSGTSIGISENNIENFDIGIHLKDVVGTSPASGVASISCNLITSDNYGIYVQSSPDGEIHLDVYDNCIYVSATVGVGFKAVDNDVTWVVGSSPNDCNFFQGYTIAEGDIGITCEYTSCSGRSCN